MGKKGNKGARGGKTEREKKGRGKREDGGKRRTGRETEDEGEEERGRNNVMELGAAAELLSQRRKGEANVTHGGEEGAAVEPRPVALFVYRRCCSLRVRREEKMLTCTIVPRYLHRAFIIVAPYSRCHQGLLPLPLRVTQQRRSRSSSAAVAGDLGCCCSYGWNLSPGERSGCTILFVLTLNLYS
nr:uncharacterized protein LOC112767198 [Arachis hypogaea]